jgi:UDP-N-acetylmuramoyl-L-alanyl-D-glutamate--2,6-diaminopimelate ligase
MRLSALTGEVASGHDPEIAGLTADSRTVAAGFLFAALPGVNADGGAFIVDAVKKGAVAVLCAPSAREKIAGDVATVIDSNPRLRLARIAARFYGPQPETVVAVTGTNGKTSIASFVRQIWKQLGHRSASLGTVGVITDTKTLPLAHTTPDPIEIHRILAELASEGIDHLAFEASSHGLAQYRVDGIKLKAAAFSNLTRDHLDYHATFEAYARAKLRLFSEVLPCDAAAVINADSPAHALFERAAREAGQRIVMVGESGRDLRMKQRAPRGDGQQLTLTWDGRDHQIALPLAGAFQASNALIAAGLALSLGENAERVFAALATIEGAPGRLEKVAASPSGAPVYVDYAHTPDAIETVLQALRPHTAGKLWIVFGCGGDRDPGKRPLMGDAAVRYADRVIVTDDNPRSENAALIRQAVMANANGAREIGDRAKAIETAIAGLEAGDVLVIAGKGHETGQIIGRETKPFNDAEVARAAASRLARAS